MLSLPDDGQIRENVTPITQLPARLPQPLPLHLTPFVGREGEMSAVRSCLRRPDVRLLTLTGPAGIGKTRLALAVATALAPDDVATVGWAPLASIREPALVLPCIARALGVAQASNSSLVEAVGISIQHRRVLVVLDNCEHVLDSAQEVAALLMACPTLRILATSREPLHISGEWIQPVPQMSLPSLDERPSPAMLRQADAVQLFFRRAESISPTFALDDHTCRVVAQVCRHLDCLPLAIELAAAHLYHMPLSMLEDRVRKRLPVLIAGPRDAPERHRTMRNAIAWSYDLLSNREQQVFRALAVFTGGSTLDAATQIVGAPTLDVLTSLVQKSLVRLDQGVLDTPRYVLLETIREYAFEQLLSIDDETVFHERHALYFLQMARDAYPWLTTMHAKPMGTRRAPADLTTKLESDHENLQTALMWFASHSRWEECLRLATLLSPFWDIRAYLSLARTWLQRGLAHADTGQVSADLCAEAMANLGLFVLRLGEFDQAHALLHDARRLWASSGDDGDRAWLLMALGGVAEYRGQDEEARQWYEQALARFRDDGNLAGVSDTLNNLADCAYRYGDLDEAERLAQEALTIGRGAALPVQIGAALVTVGAVASARQDWERAIASHREAWDSSRAAVHQLNQADALTGLAEVAASTDEPYRAARLLGAVDAMVARLGVPRLPHLALHQRAIATTQSRLSAEDYAAEVAAGKLLSEESIMTECSSIRWTRKAICPSEFSRREIEVLRLLVAGHSDRAISERLFIGIRTVESHVARIFVKLGVRNRTAAVVAALSAGLIDLPPGSASSTS